MKADRNGFFYVINRQSGKLLSAEPFVYSELGERRGPKTGMPIEDPTTSAPGGVGTQCLPEPHRRQELGADGFHQQNGLVYIPPSKCMDIASKDEGTPRQVLPGLRVQLDMAGSSGTNLSEFIAWDPRGGQEGLGYQERICRSGWRLDDCGGLVFYGNHMAS